ncbi:hypothetical protein AVEN_240098-1 [Araneus ventricosus]|uniref:Uncharacterized protein n=1 Tax=Araneus ventricosus TaxID=182803 RepID=A0A4Y2NIE1_ARAVE|nr:hypothetical protein AVEN_240098-1 [Araneus ventricosus]
MGQRFNRKKHPQNPAESFLTPDLRNRQAIIFATDYGPFPLYFKRFHIKESNCCCYCGEVGNLHHYATSCPITASYHLTQWRIQDSGRRDGCQTLWLK